MALCVHACRSDRAGPELPYTAVSLDPLQDRGTPSRARTAVENGGWPGMGASANPGDAGGRLRASSCQC